MKLLALTRNRASIMSCVQQPSYMALKWSESKHRVLHYGVASLPIFQLSPQLLTRVTFTDGMYFSSDSELAVRIP
jgi:hypothetical protein